MKKIIILIVAACLLGITVFAVSTCDKTEEVDLSSKINKKISAYRTDLSDSAETMTSSDSIQKYLSNWAESKGVAYETDDHGNIIMTVDSGEAYKNAPPTVLVCPYDAANFASCIDPVSVALYVVKNNEETGKLTVIFTEDTNHTFNGISEIDSKYFADNANVFCLNGGSKNMWSTATAGVSTYVLKDEVAHTDTKGNLAYKISIENLSGGIPDEKIAAYPNPIKELGELLAYFKTNSLIFELADIEGGNSGVLYPDSASVIIVIDEDDHEKFEKRMDTAIDNFNEKYGKHHKAATYAYEEVAIPDTVLSSEDTNSLISLLYTMIDGVYERNEDDEIISITNIGAISCTDETYTIKVSGNSLTTSGMTQIDLSYTTICGLSDVDSNKVYSVDGWTIEKPDENPFVQQVSAAFKEYSGDTMKYRDNILATNCSYIYEKNPNCNLMSITVNYKRIEKYAGTLITFLLNSNAAATTN